MTPVERDDQTAGERPSDEGAREAAEPRYVPVRRSPQLGRFLAIGAILGFIVGGLVGFLGPDAPNSSLTQEVILLGMLGVVVFTLLAAVAYLVADRRSS